MMISDHAAEPSAAPAAREGARWLARWVERLAVPRNFWAEPRENRAVGALVAEALSGWGYDVSFQGDYRNVLALPRGAGPVTLIGAHYDSVPRCPGADDNASGVAALLASARALAHRDLPVGFIAFNAEEDGLLGSRDLVARDYGALGAPPRLVHVLEMVGFRSRAPRSQRLPFPWPTRRFEKADFLALVANPAGNRAARDLTKTKAVPRPRCVSLRQWLALDSVLPALRRSDHFPFWQDQVPALLWTDTAELRNANYHQKSDTPETLDYAFMWEVVNLLVTGVLASHA